MRRINIGQGRTSPPLAVGEGTPTTFHLFQRFPGELQIEIWELAYVRAITPSRKVIHSSRNSQGQRFPTRLQVVYYQHDFIPWKLIQANSLARQTLLAEPGKLSWPGQVGMCLHKNAQCVALEFPYSTAKLTREKAIFFSHGKLVLFKVSQEIF